MNVRRYATADKVWPEVQAFLEREEAVANLPLGILKRMVDREAEASEGPPLDEAMRPFFVLATHEGKPALLMMRTPPHNMILHAPPPDTEQGAHLEAACEAGIAFLRHEELPVPGVIGPRDVGVRFADKWVEQAGGRWQVQMEQMIYRLDEVADVPLNSGALIPAQEEHLDMLVEWMIGFSEITPEGPWTPEEARERAEAHVAAQDLYLWHDGRPRSKAWSSRPTERGITVTGVYTPPAYRRQGYATSCVASLSQLLLDEGYQYCTLYTDLSNPTSNSIYRKIGYRPVRASAMIEFVG
jgi:predicted GNAT family acetyltransferase